MKSLTPERIFDYLLIVVVFLNFTNIYTFLSGLTGLSFKVFGIGSILLMVGYCMVSSASLSRFLSVKPALWFLLLFVVIPIVTTAYAPLRELRYIGYTTNSGMIFIVTGIWIIKYGWVSFSKIILLSWGVCISGIVLSYFAPAVFEQVALIQEQAAGGANSWSVVDIAESSQSRAFGFYMQSNRAGHAVIMHLLVLLPFLLHDRSYWRIVLLAVSFGAVLLTGSRGGFLVLLFLSNILFFYEFKNGVRTKHGISPGIAALPRYVLLVGTSALVGFFIITVSIQSDLLEAGSSSATRIFESLFSGEYDIAVDSSVQARLHTQEIFISRILENPILGRGHYSTEWGKYHGIIPISAHNMYLNLAYQYGIPVMLGCYALLFYLLFSREAKAVVEHFRFNPVFMLVFVLCTYSFISTTAFDLRIFPAVISFFLVMLYRRGGGLLEEKYHN